MEDPKDIVNSEAYREMLRTIAESFTPEEIALIEAARKRSEEIATGKKPEEEE
jgi:hypothetical protein